MIPMKTIVVDNFKKDSMTKNYLSKSPEDTHTKEEMDALVRAINYTHTFKNEESLSKMDEEELMERPMPDMDGLFGPNRIK